MRRLVPVVLLLVLWVPAASAWTWPVQGPVLQGFSFDPAHPFAGGAHRGVDLGASAAGVPVLAPISGTVTFAGSVPSSGITVTILTDDGLSVTLTHLGSAAVHKNDAVVEGVAVGTVGPSGTPEVDGPYVHLGVRTASDPNGYLDPIAFLPVLAPPAGEGSAPADPPAADPAPADSSPPADSAPPADPDPAAPADPAAPSDPAAPADPAQPPVESAPPADPAPAVESTPPVQSAPPVEPAAPVATPAPVPAPVSAPAPVPVPVAPAAPAPPVSAPSSPVPLQPRAETPPAVVLPVQSTQVVIPEGEVVPPLPGGAPTATVKAPAATPGSAAAPSHPSPAVRRSHGRTPGRVPHRPLPAEPVTARRHPAGGGIPLLPLGLAGGALAAGAVAASLLRLRRRSLPLPAGNGVVVQLRPPVEADRDGSDQLAA